MHACMHVCMYALVLFLDVSRYDILRTGCSKCVMLGKQRGLPPQCNIVF